MANITVTEVNDGLATIIAANALGYLKANTVASQLVIRDWDSEVASYGQTIQVAQRGTLAVNNKAANTGVTLQTPGDTPLSVTLNQHKEVSFIIEDVAKAMARPDYLNGYIMDGLAVVAEEIDADILGLYTGFSQTIDATTGLGEDDFRESRRLLNAARVPARGRFAILHEDAESELLAIEKYVNSDYGNFHGEGGPAALVDTYSGRFMGFDVFMDQMVTVATAQCKNIFGHQNSAVLATRPLPIAPAGMGVIQRAMSEDGLGIRLTLGYNQDHLGVQVTIDVLYGVAEVRDNHAVVVSTTEV